MLEAGGGLVLILLGNLPCLTLLQAMLGTGYMSGGWGWGGESSHSQGSPGSEGFEAQ